MEDITNENAQATEETPEVKKSNKELLMDRLAAMYPDVDEETMYQKLMEFMDDMERASKAHAALNEKLTQYPKAGLFIADIMDGKHPAVAHKRYFGDEVPEEGTEEYDQMIQAEQERIAEMQDSETARQEYEQNLIESAEAVKAFKESKNLSDEQFADFIESAVEMTGDLLAGKLNTTLLENMWKGRNYDSDLANETSIAEERGVIRGRNEKIEADKKKRLGDGLPMTPSGGVKPVKNENFPPVRGSVWES